MSKYCTAAKLLGSLRIVPQSITSEWEIHVKYDSEVITIPMCPHGDYMFL